MGLPRGSIAKRASHPSLLGRELHVFETVGDNTGCYAHRDSPVGGDHFVRPCLKLAKSI